MFLHVRVKAESRSSEGSGSAVGVCVAVTAAALLKVLKILTITAEGECIVKQHCVDTNFH